MYMVCVFYLQKLAWYSSNVLCFVNVGRVHAPTYIYTIAWKSFHLFWHCLPGTGMRRTAKCRLVICLFSVWICLVLGYSSSKGLVVQIYNGDNKCGFTVVTTNQHDENGENTAGIRLAQGNDLKPAFGKCLGRHTFKSLSLVWSLGLCSYARWLQQRAHTLDHGEHLLANIDFGLRKRALNTVGRSVGMIARRLLATRLQTEQAKIRPPKPHTRPTCNLVFSLAS